jgi:hypothetical protein
LKYSVTSIAERGTCQILTEEFPPEVLVHDVIVADEDVPINGLARASTADNVLNLLFAAVTLLSLFLPCFFLPPPY